MSIASSETNKGIVALVILSLIYALFGIFGRFLNTEFHLFQQVYLRTFVAFVISFVIFRGHKSLHKLKRISSKEWGLILIRSFFWYALGIPLYTLGIIYAKYGNASFIASIPATSILSLLILKEKITKQKVGVLLLVFLGIALVSIKNFSHIFVWGKGEFLELLCAFIISYAIIARRWHSKLLNDQEITQLMLFFGFIFVFLASLIMGEGMPNIHWSLMISSAIIISGILNGAQLFLINYGMKRVKGVLTGNILVLESFWGGLIGFFLYHEILSIKEFIGGLFIIISIVFMNTLVTKEK